jgi:hypothetical protein
VIEASLEALGRRRERRSAARLVPLGEAEQQCVQGRTLLIGERREEVVVELSCERTEASQSLLPFGGQADDVAPAVVGVAAALDESLLLELVEQPDQLAAVVAERVGDRTLRLTRALAEDEQDRMVIRMKARPLVGLQRLILGCEPEPLEQKGRRCNQLQRKPLSCLGGRWFASGDRHEQ